MALSCIEIYLCTDNVQIRCLYVRKNNVYITKSFTTMLHYYLLCSTFVLGWSLIGMEKKFCI